MLEKFKKLLYFCHMQCKVVCKVKKQLNLLNLYQMKRTLLFSAAMLAAAGMTVNAADNTMVQTVDFEAPAHLQVASAKSLPVFNIKKKQGGLKNYQFGKRMLAPAEELSAYYMLPQGSFYWSPDLQQGKYMSHFAYGPAYGDMTFKNYSTGSKSQTWTYEVIEGEDMVEKTSTEKDLTLNYPFSLNSYPKLAASDGVNTSNYQYSDGKGIYITGGNPSIIIQQVGSNWGFTGDETILASLSDPGYSDGFGPLNNNESAWWGQFANQAVGMPTNGKVAGFGFMLLKPDVPYALSRVFLTLSELTGDENAVITLTAYKVKEEDGANYVTDEVVATATTTVGEAMSTYIEDSYLLGFAFKEKIGELERTIDLTVDSSLFLQVDVPDGVTIAPIVDVSEQVSPDYYNSYTVFDDGYMLPWHYIAFTDETETAQYQVTSWNIALDVTYSWMFSVDNDYRFDAPVEGGSKTFNINSLYIPEGWEISDSNNALLDWVEYTPFYDETTGDMTLTFDVDPLPTEIKDRYTYVTVSAPGSSARFTIAQGDGSSVEGVETSAVVVSVVDGNFVVKGSNASMVDVYNVAGQKVASAVVDGETVVNAQDLAKGMYILKFNDNTAIKVVK